MGLLSLKRLMSTRREKKRRPRRRRRPRRQVQARDGSVISLAKRKGSPCQQQEDDDQDVKRMRNPWTSLPEDVWYHIHFLLPLRDAARTACVSSTFLCSWRRRPNLTFDEETLGLNGNWLISGRELINKVDHIMKNHSGIGLKTFDFTSYNLVNTCYLDRWLQIAITPTIEELSFSLFPRYKTKYYNFPCSILFDRGENSIKHIILSKCAFRPTGGLNFLRRLYLGEVHITGDELGCLLSNSFALEQLTLRYCEELNYLRIPCQLQQLRVLRVYGCKALQMIEVKAPNLSTFHYNGNLALLLDGGLLPVKKLDISSSYQHSVVHYVCAKLPSIVPTIETLRISSFGEKVNIVVSPLRFLHLKCLTISLHTHVGAFSPAYDYLSLAYFIEACPVLETFTLFVFQIRMEHDVISEDSSHLRQMSRSSHGNIKNVNVIGFCSAKSMIELTCHILENATSLERLTLDTIYDGYGNPNRLSVHEVGCCRPIGNPMVMEAKNAVLAIKRYVVGKVPSTVKLVVLKPCSWCHATE